MAEIAVSVAVDGHIATVTIENESRLNALSTAVVEGLQEACRALKDAPDVRCAIFTGRGRAFCAGADLKERHAMPDEAVGPFVRWLRTTMNNVAALPMPTIAAINGIAFGGGLELALACDIRIAARDAQMGLTETAIAVLPAAGGTQRLPRLIGAALAKELIFTARRLTAAEALQIGLVSRVADDALAAARQLAAEIAKGGPLAVRGAKKAIDGGLRAGLTEGMAMEQAAYEEIIPTADRREGLAAFQEKRRPVFKGE